jgi:hypothetical protein
VSRRSSTSLRSLVPRHGRVSRVLDGLAQPVPCVANSPLCAPPSLAARSGSVERDLEDREDGKGVANPARESANPAKDERGHA